jgi:hypothetical protein
MVLFLLAAAAALVGSCCLVTRWPQCLVVFHRLEFVDARVAALNVDYACVSTADDMARGRRRDILELTVWH